VNVAFLGYGTVGKAVDALLQKKSAELAKIGVAVRVTGIASRRTGWCVGPDRCTDITEWLDASKADVMFESIALDPHSGQPALDYTRAALSRGIHVISANKGPVVYGYRELAALAAKHGCVYRFESAVMDGAPVFSLVRECLPLIELRAVSGVFTSTATVVIEAIERGASREDGIREAQALGIAEADPSYDVDGWDSAVKLCALGNVLLGADLRPGNVVRTGIGDVTDEQLRKAALEGRPIRLVGRVALEGDQITAWVRPEPCPYDGVLGVVRGATLITHFEADVFPGGLTLTSRDPDPQTTAYGLVADLISVLSLPRKRAASYS
jgi:homoserine dehydrogenase